MAALPVPRKARVRLAGYVQGLKRLRKNSDLGRFPARRLWQGLKPALFIRLTARLKSCPFTKPVIFTHWDGFSAACKVRTLQTHRLPVISARSAGPRRLRLA